MVTTVTVTVWAKKNQNIFVVSKLIHTFATNHWQMTSVEAAGETFEEKQ